MGRKAASFARATLPAVPVPDKSIWQDGMVSVNTAAAFLELSRGAVYRLMRTGKLPWCCVLGRRRISRVALELVGETDQKQHGDGGH